MNNLKKIMIFLFVFLISFLMLGKNSQVSATISKPEYYSPSYCPYILSLVGVVGNDTRLIRVGGSEGKLAYCLNPSRDVPHLYDGESGQLSENDYLYYYTSDEMPGVTYIVYNGGARLAIPSISEGKTLVSNNKQWLEYAWSVNAKYDLYTGNNVPYEWVRAYFVTQNAIWWYQDLLDDANWGGSGADGFKRLGLYGDTSVIVDYHVRPDNQTTEDALAIARESADLACSSYAATKQIHTVSSLPLQCQTVYNNGSEISPKLHEVIKNKITWGDSNITITNDLSFTYTNGKYVSNKINFTTYNLIGSKEVKISNHASLPDDVIVTLNDGTMLNKSQIATTSLTSGFTVSTAEDLGGTDLSIVLYAEGSSEVIDYYIPNVTTSNGYQRLFVTDPIYVSASKTATLPSRPITSNLFVVKEDILNSNVKLEGAKFQLQTLDGDVVVEGTTNENGELQFLDIELGNYKLVEISSPANYDIITEEYTIKITELPQTQIVKNTPQIGTVTITKKDAQNNKALEGVKFELYLDANKTNKVTKDFYGNVVGNNGVFTTDNNGEIIINKLAYATYYLKEISTLENYLLNTKPISFTIDKNNLTTNVNILNEPLGSITITKQDSKNNKLLEGAIFELYKGNTKVSTDAKGNSLNILKTDANGSLTINNLLYGSYVLKEITPPINYSIEKIDTNITIDKTNQKVIIDNLPNIGSLTIYKYDNYDKKAMSGVTFKLCSDNACNNIVTKDFYGNTIGNNGTLITDTNGIIKIDNLLAGTYYIQEDFSKEGYKKDNSIRNVIITKDKNTRKEIANYRVGAIIVNKVDSKDNNVVLKDVSFRLLDSNNNVITTDANGNSLGTLKTDANGKITINNLLYGSYKLEEVSPPTNYVTVKEITNVEVNKTSITVTITNEPKIGSLKIHKYDNYNKKDLSEVGFKLCIDSDCTTEVTKDFYGNDLKTLITDDKGLINISNLLQGTYYLKEFKFKENYKIDEISRKIEIVKDETYTIEIPNDPIATLKVTKTNSETKEVLEGIKFRLCLDKDCKNEAVDAYGNLYGEKGVLTTNSKGEITILNLLYKTYYLVEIETLPNYLLDTLAKEIVIDEVNEEIALENDPLGKIKVIKADIQNLNKKLQGAIFELYKANVKVDKDAYGNPINALTTDRNGEILIENLTYGTYILREIKNPNNYKKEVIEKQIVINKDTLDSNSIITTTFTNTPIGSIRIVKKDAQNGERLSGVIFKLYDKDGNDVVDCYGNKIGEVITNNDGEILINDLVLGTYYLREVKNPSGFIVIGEDIEVKLTTNYLLKEVLNEPIEVTIIKKAMDNKLNHLDKVLSGAIIKIVDVKTEEVIYEFMTKEEEQVVRMKPGDYYFYESIAPSGYAKVPDKVLITVKDNGMIEVKDLEDKVYFDVGDKSITIYNEPSNILIDKLDITNNEEVSGATITIYDKDNKEVVRYVSDKTRKKFYLSPGIYTLKEEVAPKGYDKIVTDLKFELTNEGNVVLYEMDENLYYHLESNRITIYNGPTVITKVPDTENYIWFGGIFGGLALVLGGIYIIRKKYA